MTDKTLYYDFSRQVQSIQNEIYNTNQNLSEDTKRITQQISYLMNILEQRNRELERQLKELQDKFNKMTSS